MRSTLACSLLCAALIVGGEHALSQDASIRTVQEFLAEKGYKPGPADGLMGPRTRAALRAFQKSQGLRATGRFDDATRAVVDELRIESRVFAPVPSSTSPANPERSGGSREEGPTPVPLPTEKSNAVRPEKKETLERGTSSDPELAPKFEAAAGNTSNRDLTSTKEASPAVKAPQDRGQSQDFVAPRNSDEDGSKVRGVEKPVIKEDGEPSTKWWWLGGAILMVWLLRRRRRKKQPAPTVDLPKSREREPTTSSNSKPNSWSQHEQAATAIAVAHPSLHMKNGYSGTRLDYPSQPSAAVSKEAGALASLKTNPWKQDYAEIVKAARRSSSYLADYKEPTDPPPSEAIAPAKQSGWVPEGSSVTIAGREIGGMVYVGPPPRAGRYGDKYRAYIDPGLSVASRGDDLDGHGMPYWPGYSEITAAARATYLDWLSKGRDDPAYNVGYMFLYFYGLERRFFLDTPNIAEKREIIAEANRLRVIYRENYSARNYLGSFIDLALLSLSDKAAKEPIFERHGYELPFSLQVALGTMIAQGTALTSEWILSWWICHPESRPRTPATRCAEEFQALFRLKFMRRFPEGLLVRQPKKLLGTRYRAASGEFDVAITPSIDGQRIPDISRLRKPLDTAQEIADEAMDDLEKFSRYLGRNPQGRGTMEAQALLPEELWPLFPSLEMEKLGEWARDIVRNGGLIPIVDVIGKLEGTRPDKIGKRQSIGAADALARLGFGMAPDPRYALRNPKFDEPVVLFDLPEGEKRLENVSGAYRSALMELALGTFVAQADGRVVAAEEAALRRAVETAKGLTSSERARLSANLTWLLAVPPDLALLRKKLKDASPEQHAAVRRIVVAMAHADSVIRPQEVGGIEKIYKVLGLDAGEVYSDLHAGTAFDEPVAIRAAQETAPGEAIPPEIRQTSDRPILDADRIAAIRSDTDKVASVLGEIFAEGAQEQTEDEPDGNDEAGEPGRDLTGLDPRHSAFTLELIERQHWPDGEFDELAERHGLMAAGCLETVNEWSFGRFDDALIEQYDGYDLNAEVVQEIRANN